MGDHKDLIVFKKAYFFAMGIYNISKSFPKPEQYSLTDQVRRSSRSLCTNIGEAYRRRKYPAHFGSKLTDADAESTETQIWLDFARDCLYITAADHEDLSKKNIEVGKLSGI